MKSVKINMIRCDYHALTSLFTPTVCEALPFKIIH